MFLWFHTGPQPKSTNQKRPYNISILCKHINITHTHTPCLMMGEVSLETSPKNIMIQDMINSENSMNTTESTNTNIFKIVKQIDELLFHLKIVEEMAVIEI